MSTPDPAFEFREEQETTDSTGFRLSMERRRRRVHLRQRRSMKTIAAVACLMAGCGLIRARTEAPAPPPAASGDAVFTRVFEAARDVLAERFEVLSADPASGEIRAAHPAKRFRGAPRLVLRVLIHRLTDRGVDIEVRAVSLQPQRDTLFPDDPDTMAARFSQGTEDPVVEREVRDLVLARIGGPRGMRP